MKLWKKLFIIGIITFSLETLVLILSFLFATKIAYSALIWMILWGIWSIVCYVNWQKEVKDDNNSKKINIEL